MKKLLSILIVLGITISLSAQYQFIIQRNDLAFTYDVIDTAFAHLENNDTLYLPAGTFKTNASGLETDKKIHVIGAGYYKGINDDIPISVIQGQLTLLDGADGSTFEGFRLSGYFKFGNDASNADVDNISVKRCRFDQMITLGTNGEVQYVHFNECIFISWVEAKQASHLSFKNCFFNGQLRYVAGNTLVDHCIIESQFNYTSNLTISNSILEQGGTIGGTNTGYSLINCLFHETDPDEYFKNSPNLVSNCYGPAGWDDIFMDVPVDIYTNGYDAHHDYRLKETSFYKNAGSDGTDIGLYGGFTSFKHSRLPGNPQVLSSDVSAETDENGMLNIQITVEAQEY